MASMGKSAHLALIYLPVDPGKSRSTLRWTVADQTG
jgi:hypothetical protein